MKVTVIISLLLLAVTGCGPADTELSSKADDGLHQLSEYNPVKINIMPLTEFTADNDDEKPSKIKVFVSLLDSFDSQMKTPAVFRFELYERIPRSAEPKGPRILLWPDIDLKNPAKNNKYWKDFLRAYEFDLPFEPETDKSYILQITALCPGGKRLSADFILK